jgi:hypothetical protein
VALVRRGCFVQRLEPWNAQNAGVCSHWRLHLQQKLTLTLQQPSSLTN